MEWLSHDELSEEWVERSRMSSGSEKGQQQVKHMDTGSPDMSSRNGSIGRQRYAMGTSVGGGLNTIVEHESYEHNFPFKKANKKTLFSQQQLDIESLFNQTDHDEANVEDGVQQQAVVDPEEVRDEEENKEDIPQKSLSVRFQNVDLSEDSGSITQLETFSPQVQTPQKGTPKAQTTNGSPLKLFQGDYDTFTNEKLSKMVEQLAPNEKIQVQPRQQHHRVASTTTLEMFRSMEQAMADIRGIPINLPPQGNSVELSEVIEESSAQNTPQLNNANQARIPSSRSAFSDWSSKSHEQISCSPSFEDIDHSKGHEPMYDSVKQQFLAAVPLNHARTNDFDAAEQSKYESKRQKFNTIAPQQYDELAEQIVSKHHRMVYDKEKLSWYKKKNAPSADADSGNGDSEEIFRDIEDLVAGDVETLDDISRISSKMQQPRPLEGSVSHLEIPPTPQVTAGRAAVNFTPLLGDHVSQPCIQFGQLHPHSTPYINSSPFPVLPSTGKPGLPRVTMPKEISSKQAGDESYRVLNMSFIRHLTDFKPFAEWQTLTNVSLSDKHMESLHGLADHCPKLQVLDVSLNLLEQVDGIPSSVLELNLNSNRYLTFTQTL